MTRPTRTAAEPTTDMLLVLTAAVEEFWPSDKPGAVLLAPEIAAEIVNFLHANDYQIEAIAATPERAAPKITHICVCGAAYAAAGEGEQP